MRVRARRGWVLFIVMPLGLVSCASSLQRPAGQAEGVAMLPSPSTVIAEGGLADRVGPEDVPSGTEASQDDAQPALAAGPDGGGASQAGSPAAPAPARSQAPAVAPHRGIDAERILVGVVELDTAGLQQVEGVNIGDPRRQASAVIEYLNAQGGIAGRRLEAVFARIDAASNDWERDYQSACTALTQDHGVFAVVNATIAYARTFLPCLARHETLFINSAGGAYDHQVSRQFADYFYTPGSMDLTRLGRSYAQGLLDTDFFSAANPAAIVKVGLLRPTGELFERVVAQELRPRLERAGVPLALELGVDAHRSISHTVQQMPNAVLRFQQSGINRVLVLDNGTLAVAFSIQAAVQGYQPRYGFNSLNNPVLIQQNVPSSALDGSIGIGWQPTGDVDELRDPGNNRAGEICQSIMASAGESNVSRTGQWSQQMHCDGFFFLHRALSQTPDPGPPSALRAEVERFGASYVSPITFRTAFGPGRNDGADAIQTFVYGRDCSCFSYIGQPRPTES